MCWSFVFFLLGSIVICIALNLNFRMFQVLLYVPHVTGMVMFGGAHLFVVTQVLLEAKPFVDI